MQTLTLYISSFNLTDDQLANIKAYLSKWAHIFGYKIPVKLEYHFVERVFGSVASVIDNVSIIDYASVIHDASAINDVSVIADGDVINDGSCIESDSTQINTHSFPYWNKELCEIGCSFSNLATLGLDLLIGAGVILEYNIQDITDIKDSKLSIDCDDLIDFRNVEMFVQNPCISALRKEAEQIVNTDNDALLKHKGDIMTNIKRYDFTLYNYLALRSYLIFNNLLEHAPYSEIQHAYNWMFNAEIPQNKRLEMAMEIFCRVIKEEENTDTRTDILLDLYKAYSEILVIFEKHNEGFAILEKYHKLADSAGFSFDDKNFRAANFKRLHQYIICMNY